MNEYRILWETVLHAHSPHEAAQLARHAQMDPESAATFYEVINTRTNERGVHDVKPFAKGQIHEFLERLALIMPPGFSVTFGGAGNVELLTELNQKLDKLNTEVSLLSTELPVLTQQEQDLTDAVTGLSSAATSLETAVTAIEAALTAQQNAVDPVVATQIDAIRAIATALGTAATAAQSAVPTAPAVTV